MTVYELRVAILGDDTAVSGERHDPNEFVIHRLCAPGMADGRPLLVQG
jgi:hypothetical protein